jgi:hypothetical protein
VNNYAWPPGRQGRQESLPWRSWRPGGNAVVVQSKIRNLKSKIPSRPCRNYAIHYPAPMREDLFTRLATLTERTRNLQVSL